MKLKVGHQFEVVEVLTDGNYLYEVFNIGGHTLHFKEHSDNSGFTLINKSRRLTGALFMEKYGCSVVFMNGSEVKPVGRLTVTKIKKS